MEPSPTDALSSGASAGFHTHADDVVNDDVLYRAESLYDATGIRRPYGRGEKETKLVFLLVETGNCENADKNENQLWH